jgi:autotransporter strand-loop-strand O-heptosyltransferase
MRFLRQIRWFGGESDVLMSANYNPALFFVADLEEARQVILTPEGGRSTEDRWNAETPYLLDLVGKHLQLTTNSVVVDYGCGIGRLARELISHYGCQVIGVDISSNMRTLAERYVGSERFLTCAPEGLNLFGEGFADAALAVWVLQHCPQVDVDFERIKKSLKADGELFVVNEKNRCIPTDKGWASDGLDILQILGSEFECKADGQMDSAVVTKSVADRTFWALFKKNADRFDEINIPTPTSQTSSRGSKDLAVDGIASSPPAFSKTASIVIPSGARTSEKPAYPPPAKAPTQQGPKGIQFDFNDGCRAVLPDCGEPWQVRLSDLDTGNILFETKIATGHINSSKRYYVRIRIEVLQNGEVVFEHNYSAADRDVLIQFPVGTIGDTIGWLPYAIKFKEHHGCRLTCAIAERLIPLFQDAYPDVTFLKHDDIKAESYYATYSLGLFFDDKDFIRQPCDFRLVGLHRTAGYILGVDPTEAPPRIVVADSSRPISEPYVCIAVQSTTQSKYWNNPHGWREIVALLKSNGYRVICIDQKPTHGYGLTWNHVPNGAVDETGDRPLQERARWLSHADFFVGLSSGLSWMAWAVGTPVVMISGFTHPTNEFSTPYRVINYHTCNSCWNDPQHRFDHKDFFWCPRHKGTSRQFECTRLITTDQVKIAIQRIPNFFDRSRKTQAVHADGTIRN